MDLRIGMFVVLVACGNPVETCDNFPRTDCCSTNEQCFEVYGVEYPFCNRPDHPDGGTCSVCQRDGDCDAGEECSVDGHGFGVCAPE